METFCRAFDADEGRSSQFSSICTSFWDISRKLQFDPYVLWHAFWSAVILKVDTLRMTVAKIHHSEETIFEKNVNNRRRRTPSDGNSSPDVEYSTF